MLRSLFGQLASEYGPAANDPSATAAAAGGAPSECGDAASVIDDSASSCCGDGGGGAGGGGRVTWSAEMAFLQVRGRVRNAAVSRVACRQQLCAQQPSQSVVRAGAAGSTALIMRAARDARRAAGVQAV